MLSTLVTMSLMSTLGSDMTLLSNTTNKTYEVILEQFNSSNCSVPFQNLTYVFNCSNINNKSWCCKDEYNKLNTSFGNAECNRYDKNDTYVRFICLDDTGSKSKSMKPYEVVAISVGVTLVFIFTVYMLIKCLNRCKRKQYNKI